MTTRSHHRKKLRRDAETTGHVPESQDCGGGAASAAADGGFAPQHLVETRDDIRLIGRLRKRSDWIIPERARSEVPENLLRLSQPADEDSDDDKRTDSTQIAASRELRMLSTDNWRKDASSINITFNPNVQGVLSPQSPQRPTANVVDAEGFEDPPPVAFFEEISQFEASDTLATLDNLGFLAQILDADQRDELRQEVERARTNCNTTQSQRNEP